MLEALDVVAQRDPQKNLSWGLRIKPGETHARDSTCVLIESGSDDNRFFGNDCTHGGDGIFIRVLNGWTSRRNYFEGNDTSYANNNGFEAWSPENTYVKNKANHCSYGFWLGASDKTRLVGNEAGYNGSPDGFHNAPESFGHGGIVFVNGPSSHTFLDGNWCHHNQGGGIVLRGDEATAGAAWKAYHWVIQRNKLESNRWGIYARHADWLTLGSNEFTDNREGDFFDAGNVTNVVLLQGKASASSEFRITHFDRWWHTDPSRHRGDIDHRPEAVRTALLSHKRVPFAPRPTVKTSAGVTPRYRWEFGDGRTSSDAEPTCSYDSPGIFRVGVTVDDGELAALDWSEVVVPDGVEETFNEATRWSVRDASGVSRVRIISDRHAPSSEALHAHIEPYDGGRVELVYSKMNRSLHALKELVFWLRVRNENIPAWQDANPIVTLKQDDEHVARYVPERDLLSQPLHNEGRDGWNRFVVPLAGGNGWEREGPELTKVTELALGFDSWGAPPLDIWLDILAFR
ncbi:MAG: right-handed parallel beta-helix repeat-containing protein [Planctomycetes bacterium]|nr:right-handed parallel beta-helix repeat-containing protein [Planctomycetota bacterium]